MNNILFAKALRCVYGFLSQDDKPNNLANLLHKYMNEVHTFDELELALSHVSDCLCHEGVYSEEVLPFVKEELCANVKPIATILTLRLEDSLAMLATIIVESVENFYRNAGWEIVGINHG